MNVLKTLLVSTIFFSAAALGCDGGDAERSADPKAKANEVCGADEKAKIDGGACKACCKDNGVSSYQYDGMNQTCTCG
ncbi:MAG: hypothetical protein ACE37F_27085 [Nannocystaceae bacterium]|nr:hypothetical protein [bacterium]